VVFAGAVGFAMDRIVAVGFAGEVTNAGEGFVAEDRTTE